MIQSGEVKLLTYISKFGNILILSVSPENSKYIDIKGQIQTEFVIKLVLISNNEKRYEYSFPRKDKKSTTTKTNFLKEAISQQSVWSQSILYGGEEFSPSVVNFALFNNANGKILLEIMQKKYINAEYEKSLSVIGRLMYLLDNNQNLEIGILVMPYILNTISLKAKVLDPQRSPILRAYANTVINILRLYLFHKLLLRDLHEDNILITRDEDSYILDFGYTSDAAVINSSEFVQSKDWAEDSSEDSLSEDSLSEDSLSETKESKEFKYQTNVSMFNSLCIKMEKREKNDSDSNEEKTKCIQYILCGILNNDRNEGGPLSEWMYDIPNKLFLNHVFDKLCELRHKYMSGDGFNIAATLSPNQIFDLSSHVDSYYYMFPQTLKSTTQTVKTTIRKGSKVGKSKKGGKKTKRNNKSKKSKKTNKPKKSK
jgi:hypothetical protein